MLEVVVTGKRNFRDKVVLQAEEFESKLYGSNPKYFQTYEISLEEEVAARVAKGSEDEKLIGKHFLISFQEQIIRVNNTLEAHLLSGNFPRERFAHGHFTSVRANGDGSMGFDIMMTSKPNGVCQINLTPAEINHLCWPFEFLLFGSLFKADLIIIHDDKNGNDCQVILRLDYPVQIKETFRRAGPIRHDYEIPDPL